MNIYLDMDDVVADWMAHAQDFLKMRWNYKTSDRIPQADWDKLKNNSHFYRFLPLKADAHELVDYCRNLTQRTNGTLQFLTALPTSNCNEWMGAGGRAHIYRDWPTCYTWFKEVTK